MEGYLTPAISIFEETRSVPFGDKTMSEENNEYHDE